MIRPNPYSPTSHGVSDEPNAVPKHSPSLVAESWRGFRLGAKLTAIATATLVVLIAIFAVGTFVYMMVVTRGDFARSVVWTDVAEWGLGSVAMIAVMALYGGVAGAVVMAFAAAIRKLIWKVTQRPVDGQPSRGTGEHDETW